MFLVSARLQPVVQPLFHLIKFTQTTPKMLGTLTRNDERCSDRSPRPRSFFSGRMPSFPPSVKKNTPTASSLWFPCGGSYFLVFNVAYIRGVVASSSMALFSGFKVSPPVENRKRRWWFCRSEGPWQCERRWWLLVDLSVSSACWRCLPATTQPCHQNVSGETAPPNRRCWKRQRGCRCGPAATPTGGNADVLQIHRHLTKTF